MFSSLAVLPSSFTKAAFNSWILVRGDSDGRQSAKGGFRRDLRAIFREGVEPGGFWEDVLGGSIGWGIRGRVYYAIDFRVRRGRLRGRGEGHIRGR